jgi:hypothetical protein
MERHSGFSAEGHGKLRNIAQNAAGRPERNVIAFIYSVVQRE